MDWKGRGTRALVLASGLASVVGCEGTLGSGSASADSPSRLDGFEGDGDSPDEVPFETPMACQPDALPTRAPSLYLSQAQLLRSINDLLGASPLALSDLPSDIRTTSFIQAEVHRASADGLRQLGDAAARAAEHAISAGVSHLLPCSADAFDAECRDSFVDSFLSRAFRRPATPEEVERYGTFFATAAATHGLDEGIGLFIEATLLSPPFLYRFEAMNEAPDENNLAPLDSFSLATRLSYFLTGGPPDEELRTAASNGTILLGEELSHQALRLLEQPGSEGMVRFFQEFLHLDFDLITKGSEILDGVASQEELSAGWRLMFADFIEHLLLEEDGSLVSLLTSPHLSIPDELSGVYSSAAPRSGLLTQPGLLAALAHDHSSPVLRGVFIRDHLLCDPVPPPPPGVEANIPAADIASTTRERYANLEADPSCRTCHQLIHSVGFGLESFDALGRFRTEEGGQPIDASGELIGFRDPSLVGTFDTPAELGAQMAASRQFGACINQRLYEAAMARMLDTHDACALEALGEKTADAETANLKDMIVELVTSPRFTSIAASSEGDFQ